MSLNISSKQMDITPAIRTHIEERLAMKWMQPLVRL